jgi:hypothetical protein
MLYATVAIFAIAAGLGLVNLLNWMKQKDAPRTTVYTHGLFAATGLVLLIVYAVQNPDAFPKIAIGLFTVAALGGFYLFYTDVTKKPHPLAIAFVHALIAVSGFVMLLLFVFGKAS